MKKAFLLMTVLLLAAVFLGGCMPGFGTTALPSGQTATPVPTVGPTVEPQVLISKSDAEAIVGNALKDDDDGKLNGVPSSGMKYVNYESAVAGGHFLQVSIYETAFYGANVTLVNPVDIFNQMITASPTPKPTPTPATPATPAPSGATATPISTPTAAPTPTPTPTLNPSEITPVTGIGDKAYYALPGLHIMSNGYYIIISVGTIDSATPEGQANRQILKTLGLKVVENLNKALGK